MSSEKDIYRYSDLTAKGYGSRTKLWSSIKAGKFPQPDADDGSGHPIWFAETLKKHRESLEPYSPSLPTSLRQVLV